MRVKVVIVDVTLMSILQVGDSGVGVHPAPGRVSCCLLAVVPAPILSIDLAKLSDDDFTNAAPSRRAKLKAVLNLI